MVRHAPLGLNVSQQADDLPEAVKRTRFRSQLEIRFALEAESRGLRWFYEPERICRYLVDFYLPDGKAWVEVKGRVSSRDHLLLREVALAVRAERGQRLFMWTSGRAYLVGEVDFLPMTHAQFWPMLMAIPDTIATPPRPKLIR